MRRSVHDCLDWLERNHMAKTEEIERKLLEFERDVCPIMIKVVGVAEWHFARTWRR